MSVSEQFKGLPMEDLIGAPLIAAANAQGKLANLTKDFVEKVGADETENKNRRFYLGNLITRSGINEVQEVEKSLSVPLLSIVNVHLYPYKK